MCTHSHRHTHIVHMNAHLFTSVHHVSKYLSSTNSDKRLQCTFQQHVFCVTIILYYQKERHASDYLYTGQFGIHQCRALHWIHSPPIQHVVKTHDEAKAKKVCSTQFKVAQLYRRSSHMSGNFFQLQKHQVKTMKIIILVVHTALK